MALNITALLEAPIIELDYIDSTNNYAMQLIDADTAQPGLTIVAKEQTRGKGQRGRTWTDTPGQSLLMSIITVPEYALTEQFVFNAVIATAIANVLQKLYEHWDIAIKWPNDIIVNDKKAGGILIENVLRGSSWAYSVIGFGLNVNQESFPADLPFATSLNIASGKQYDIDTIRDMVRNEILLQTAQKEPAAAIKTYNDFLFRKGKRQVFMLGDKEWEGIIVAALSDGSLQVQLADGKMTWYTHGAVTWKWGN